MAFWMRASQAWGSRFPGAGLLFGAENRILLPSCSNKSSSLLTLTIEEIPAGYLLERKEMFSTTPTGNRDCGFSETVPLDCFGKTTPSIPNHLVKIFHFLGKQETAKPICNMALEVLRDQQLNRQAHCTLARTHMKMYLQDLEHAKMGQGPVPDRRKLMHAKNHLEGSSPPPTLDKAMEFDLGDTIPKLQLFRGKCLWLKSQETLAIECFKQGIEVDNAGTTKSLWCLWQTLLLLFGKMKLQKKTLMDEVEQWVKKVEEKFPQQHLQQELRAVCHNHSPEVTRLRKAMVAQGRTALAKLLLGTMKANFSTGGMKERPLTP
ncbi:PREDICTED: tetratricopeptide repeat protein 22 [Charadrius vociferus]|uniref:tetratricopeptide repeat protein 22 n=1 Tax=Charadrius vociferus TaxID=50402 RepID=UPI000521AB13|nr:PREDICTED: tetratricopeptide repeat protein 22 [Charadrius vociferus]